MSTAKAGNCPTCNGPLQRQYEGSTPVYCCIGKCGTRWSIFDLDTARGLGPRQQPPTPGTTAYTAQQRGG